MSMMMRFTVVGGAVKGATSEFPPEKEVLFGRTRDADVRLTEADVSGRHFIVSRRGDDVLVRCLSRYGMKVSGEALAEGESRPLLPGDVLAAGATAVVRYDGGGPEEDEETFDPGDTVATTFFDEPETEAGAMSVPPPVVPPPVVPPPVVPPTVTWPFSDGGAETSSAPVPAPSVAPTTDAAPFDDGVTLDETPPAVPPSQAGFDPTLPSLGGQDTVDPAPTGEGETCEVHTIAGSMDEILALKAAYERKGKIKRVVLLSVIGLFFLSLAGVYFFTRKNRETEWMSIPRPVRIYQVSTPDGRPLLRVDYPYSPAASVIEAPDGGGIKVISAMGRDRDVPYRLQFEIVRDEAELDLSLEESLWAWMQRTQSREKGILWEIQAANEVKPGFFEDRYAWCCQLESAYGIRYVMTTYQCAREEGVVWRGILLYLRSGDTVYALRREIPDVHWKRGVGQLTVDPNLGVFADYTQAYWESPGAAALPLDWSVADLEASVKEHLNPDRPGFWGKVRDWIDALLVKTWRSDAETRARAFEYLGVLRKFLQDYYNAKMNAFEVAESDERTKKMRRIRQDAKIVFDRPTDRRYFLLGDGSIW